jgi:putative ABC transport system permease protein
MREIGIRKVLGGLKRQLVFQFLIESIIIVLFSTLVAIAIYVATHNLFNGILGNKVPKLTGISVILCLGANTAYHIPWSSGRNLSCVGFCHQ